jgi:kynureninase
MLDVVEQQWGQDLISSWNKHRWIDLAESVGAKIAPLLGVNSNQLIVCDSISVNLFKLLNIALTQRPSRSTILSSTNNFPTDLYVAQGLETFLGDRQCALKTVDANTIATHLNDDVAVLMLTQVDFRSGALFDIQALTQSAHDAGALVIWDLAHSTGVVPLELNKWNVDFAVGCGYKFLNGGPGAPAFVSIHQRFLDSLAQPIQGWMGHARPFDFDPIYTGAASTKQMLTGTPPILSLSALDAAMDVYADVNTQQLRDKSLSLSGFFIHLFDVCQKTGSLKGLKLCARLADKNRGSHVSLEHTDAYAISQALIDNKVIIDFRAPNLIRFGFSPLYNSHLDVVKSLDALRKIMLEETYKRSEYEQRKTVT